VDPDGRTAGEILSASWSTGFIIAMGDSPIPGPADIAGAVVAVGGTIVAGVVAVHDLVTVFDTPINNKPLVNTPPKPDPIITTTVPNQGVSSINTTTIPNTTTDPWIETFESNPSLDYNTSGCGVNMSCAENDNGLPLYGQPNTTGLQWGSDGAVTQGRTWDDAGNPSIDTDFSDHNRPDTHTDPHQHEWKPNPDGSFDHNSRSPPINNPSF
jgi:hypothetical protein